MKAAKPRVIAVLMMLLDEFYLRVKTAEKAFASVETDKLKQETQRLKRVVAEQEKSVGEDEAKSERDRQVGNVIYAHFNELQTFQEQLLKANLQGHDWNTIITTVLAAKKQANHQQLTLKGSTAKTLH